MAPASPLRERCEMRRGAPGPRWGWLLVPPLLLSVGLLLASQAVFLRLSLFEDLGLGMVGEEPTLANYLQAFVDPFYLQSLAVTAWVSLLVVLIALAVGYP